MKARCNNLFPLQAALTTLKNGLLQLQSRSFLGERLVLQKGMSSSTSLLLVVGVDHTDITMYCIIVNF